LIVVSWVWSLRDSIVDMVKDGERGQDLIEYVVIAGFIGLAAAAAFVFTDIGGAIEDFSGVVVDCIRLEDNCGE
jgi:hypothetical protein